MIRLNRNIEKTKNYAVWIQTASQCTEDIYADIVKDVGPRFDSSNYEIDRRLPKEKVIGIMKDELGERIMKEFTALRAKTYSYLTDNNKEDEKGKGTKTCVIKRKIKFEDYETLFRSNSN